MAFIYKLFHKLASYFRKKYIIARISFSSKEAKRTFKVIGRANILNKNITIGSNVVLFDGVTIWGNGKITIGDNVKIGFNVIIYAHQDGGVVIGENTVIAGGTYIIDTNHSTKPLDCSPNPLESLDDFHKKIIIGKNVWVASSCVISLGSQLNDGCVVGANSFVNGIIPTNAVAVGSPARVIKFRQ